MKLLLFDLDGTLTPARNKIDPAMKNVLKQIASNFSLAIVSGSDYPKILYQLDEDSSCFEYICSENGTVIHKKDKLVKKDSIQELLGEDFIQDLINFIFLEFSKIKLPFKRGNFIEFRNGLINISPVGRSCSQEERELFFLYDKEHKVRKNLVTSLKEKFGEEKLTYSIGGQISIDIFPQGWDKRHCLEFFKDYESVFFFGDQTQPGGNDHEIFNDSRVQGKTVVDYIDTMRILKEMKFC